MTKLAFHFLRLSLFFSLPPVLPAESYRLSPQDDWYSVIHGSQLSPGDEVFLTAGVYSDPRRISIDHRGSEDKPIIIRGENGTIFRRPDANQNSFNIEGSQFLVLRNIEVTGGCSGIRISQKQGFHPRSITLESLHIHHVGGPAITCNDPESIYQQLVFLNNHIHHTAGHGEGFYLGCNNDKEGNTPGYIANSLIQGNYIHHLNGSEISQGDGIEIKDGSYGNIIRHNVIHDTKYPGITVYGTDGNQENLIENNIIWNSGDHGIQAAAEATITNNHIAYTANDGIRSKPHQSASPGNIKIVGNSIYSSEKGSLIRIDSSPQAHQPILVEGNRLIPKGDLPSLRIPGSKNIQVIDSTPQSTGASPILWVGNEAFSPATLPKILKEAIQRD